MSPRNYNKRKKSRITLFIVFLTIIEFSLVFSNASARTETIPTFWTSDVVRPNEHVSYYFPNNIIFEISTNSKIDLYVRYENKISNRQSSFHIRNNESISLNITSKISLRNFGITKSPHNPKEGDFQLRYQYNNILFGNICQDKILPNVIELINICLVIKRNYINLIKKIY